MSGIPPVLIAALSHLKISFAQNKDMLICAGTVVMLASILAISVGAEAAGFKFLLIVMGYQILFYFGFFGLQGARYYVLGMIKSYKMPRNDRKDGKFFREAETHFYSGIDEYLLTHRVVYGLPMFAAMILVTCNVGLEKSLIPYFTHYQWDPFLASLDSLIHFGHYPHEFIVPFVEKLGLFKIVNASYNIWFAVMLFANWYAIFYDTDLHRARRFVWATLITWIVLGWGLAWAMPSVGPIFYHDFYSAMSHQPYTEFINHLKELYEGGAWVQSVHVSPLLLEMSRNNQVIDLNGISAMPSLHVAIAFLIFLYSCSFDWKLRVLSFVFLFDILVGSVYLGWHYAVDGYLAAILTWVIWYACKKMPLKGY